MVELTGGDGDTGADAGGSVQLEIGTVIAELFT